jgi:cysteinyl-tRNA synthetase
MWRLAEKGMMKTNSFSIFLLLAILTAVSCNKDGQGSGGDGQKDYKDEMRNFVTGISQYSKNLHPGFFIIPQNGQELVTSDGKANGSLDTNYLGAIDGQGREDLFYGYYSDDAATPNEDREYIIAYLDRIKQSGKPVLVTDYCFTQTKMSDSYLQNDLKGYVSFAADHRELDDIPAFPPVINNQNSNDVTSLTDVKNFLYLIDPSGFTKSQFIDAVNNTDYDLVIMDLFITENDIDVQFSAAEIESMKHKKDGGSRLMICYMSIGEAEDYRYYWQADWSSHKPSWLGTENPDWPRNYKVKYWDKNWQNIIFGNDQSYLKKILDAHFDGVYLDMVDAFENFE